MTFLLGISLAIVPELAFAEIETDKSVYLRGEPVRVSGTVDFQNDDRVNIIQIEITNSDTDDTIVNMYTPLDDDNSFSSSYDSAAWPAGDYEVKIIYNYLDEIAEFTVSDSSSSSNNNKSDNDHSNNDNLNNTQESTPSSYDLPLSPTNLTADVISSTQIDLSWSAPSGDNSLITGYKIEHRTNTNPNYFVTVENTHSTETTYSHTDLTPDTVYAYRISAINSVGTSEPSSSTTVKTSSNNMSGINESITDLEYTDVPSNVMAEAISSTDVELEWNPPTQTYGQTIQDYTIKQEIASNVYDEIASTSDTKHIISGLDPGQTYTFVVVANYALGSSNISDEITVTLASTLDKDSVNNDLENNNDNSSVIPDGIPDSPADLKVQPISSTQIDLSWSAPNDDNINNDSITGYKIEVRTISNATYSTVIEDTESTGTTYSHTGLIPETTYIYRVYAINSIGTSEPSDENLVNTLASDSEFDKKEYAEIQDDSNFDEYDLESSSNVFNPPTDLTATAVSQSRIDLSWSAPIDTSSSALLGYKIESKTSNESDYSVLVRNTGTMTTTYSHTGLTAGLTYEYRVSAITSSGQSFPSDPAEATIISNNNRIESELSSSLQPLTITLSLSKNVYDFDDPIEISGIITGSTQNMPIGMRIISSNDTIVYVRSISADNSTFEIMVPPTQRQSSAWQNNDEFTIEVTHNGRIQATSMFEIYDENTSNTSEKSASEVGSENESNVPRSQFSNNTSANIPSNNTLNSVNALNSQNLALQSANQQLQDENNQLKIQIEELNKRIEQLDAIVKEQIRVMMETLNILKSNG
ncbi:MAG: fibronectin type III domain-containing protein [Nitrosarchaeum sp.]|nr:fibronectin type III domain-containing protein [Nitrosarchaeum sp.]